MCGMRPLCATFKREVRRASDSVTYLCSLTLLPLLALGFFALYFAKSEISELPITLVDRDDTSLSRTLISMLDATPQIQVRYEAESPLEAERLMLQGRSYATLLIPEGFERECTGFGTTHIELYDSGTNLTANGFIAKQVQTTAETLSAAIRIETLQGQGVEEKVALAEIMPLAIEAHLLFNPYVNYGYYIAPGFMAMMLLILTVITSVTALGSELKQGTAAEWLATAGGSLGVALVGKMLLVTMAMCGAALVMFALLFVVIDLPLAGSGWMVALATLLLILCYEGLSVFVVSMTSSMRLALSLGGGYSVLAFTFSGLTFPVMAMSTPLQWLSYLFPYTYYMRIVVDQILRGAPIGLSLSDAARMMLFWILPLILMPRLKRIAQQPRYWGRA